MTIDGQIDLFDYMDNMVEDHNCLECANCKYTDMFKPYVDSKGIYHELAFCNLTRSLITEHTKSWLCKNQYYERKKR